jgi:septum formation protein
MTLPIVLASQSLARKRLMAQLNLPFSVQPTDIDETPTVNEAPDALVERLSHAKALAVNATDDTVIIAGDQVICVGDQILGKPHNFENACEQLSKCSGQTCISYTGLSVHCRRQNFTFYRLVTTQIHYRKLTTEFIQAYLKKDQPYACAGSIQLEKNGYRLIEKLTSDDPYAIYGLPLFSLVTALEALDCLAFA